LKVIAPILADTTQLAEEPYAATRSAAILTVLSVLSPFSGLLMEMVLAWGYGASGVVDAFRIASLLLVLGNQLFFGYLLPHVTVPLFSEYRAQKDLNTRDGGWLFCGISIKPGLADLRFLGMVRPRGTGRATGARFGRARPGGCFPARAVLQPRIPADGVVGSGKWNSQCLLSVLVVGSRATAPQFVCRPDCFCSGQGVGRWCTRAGYFAGIFGDAWLAHLYVDRHRQGFAHQVLGVFEAGSARWIAEGSAFVAAFGCEHHHWTVGQHNYKQSTE